MRKNLGILFAVLLLAGTAFGQGPSRINNGGKGGGASGLTLPSGTDTGAANAYVVTTNPAQAKTPLTPTLYHASGVAPGGTTSRSFNMTTGGALNNVIIVAVTTEGLSSPPTFSVSENQIGYSFQPLTGVFGSATPGYYGQFFYAVIGYVFGGNDTFTCTASAGTNTSCVASEWVNLSVASLNDGSNSQTAASSSGTVSVPSFSATNGDLLFGYGVAGTAIATGSGFTEIVHISGNQNTEQQTLSGATAAVTFNSSSGPYLAMAVAVRPLYVPTYGDSFTFTAANANTGASTMDATGFGPVPLRAFDQNGNAADLVSGLIVPGTVYQATSDGLEWLLSGLVNITGQGPPNLNAGTLNLAGGYTIKQSTGQQQFNPVLTILGVPAPGNLPQNRFMFNIACPPVTPANGCGNGKLLNFGWDYDGVAIIGSPGTTIGFLAAIETFAPVNVFSSISAEQFRFNAGGAAGNFLMVVNAPTVSSGFGTGASVTSNNGTASFRINVGTSNTGTGVIALPAATTGWNCSASDVTTTSAAVSQTKQVGPGTTTSVTLQNYTDISATGAWVDSDVLLVQCFAF